MQEARLDRGAVRAVAMSRGTQWWRDAWAIFRSHPGAWLVQTLITAIVLIALALIPLVGGLAATLLGPAIAGGWMLAADKAHTGETPPADALLSGLRERATPLLVLGALALIASLLATLVVAGLGANALIGLVLGGSAFTPEALLTAVSAGLMALLVGLAVSLAITMALWFAPALVVLHGVAPLEAIKASFAACTRNGGAFLAYGLVYTAFAVLASIPLGLGWLVLAPLTALGAYVAYRDIFGV